LQSRPKLDQRQVYYYNAYQQMSRSRSAGMGGALPIPVTEILAYCELFYIAQLDERERIFRYVNRLDDAYLAHVAEKTKK
jgi:hypothetical protein